MTNWVDHKSLNPKCFKTSKVCESERKKFLDLFKIRLEVIKHNFISPQIQRIGESGEHEIGERR